MTPRNRLIFTVCLALLSGTWLSAPSLAQKSEAAALSAKINELGRAGKYAEAMALAQGQVETLEKKYGPTHRDVGAAINNLAQLHGKPLPRSDGRHRRGGSRQCRRSRYMTPIMFRNAPWCS